MRAAVITFPGSNCDRDLAVALERHGANVKRIWHDDTDIGDVDLIGVPGGFSFGDYLRCGAISARSPIMRTIKAAAGRGVFVLGICNGFQILAECGLLPGALVRNAGLKFVCKPVSLRVATINSAFSNQLTTNQLITLPVAHHDGNYTIDQNGLKALQDQDRIAFTYVDNPNGSIADIAGVLGGKRNVLGLMPHPERAADPQLGMNDGSAIISSLLNHFS